MFIKDNNGINLVFVSETWLSFHGDEVRTAELTPSGFDIKSFPHIPDHMAEELL